MTMTKPNRANNMFSATNKAYSSLFLAMVAAGMSSGAIAKGEIDTVTLTTTQPTAVSYSAGGTTYNWGTGLNQILTGVSFGGESYSYNAVKADTIAVRRVNNSNTSGERCTLYAAEFSDANGVVTLAPDLPVSDGICNYTSLLSEGIVNRGTLDIFTNNSLIADRTYTNNNIERLDFLFSSGVSTPAQDLDKAGHVVLEKSGNNPVKIAAVLSVDSAGNPTAYGDLVTINIFESADTQALRFGQVQQVLADNAFLSTIEGEDAGNPVKQGQLQEVLGAAFVSVEDLGLSAQQTYFGFSLFATDVDASVHNLTDPSTFPLDTPLKGPGDADVQAGSAGNLIVNAGPSANNDAVSTTPDQAVTIDVLANDTDADGDNLTVSESLVLANGALGTAEVVNGQIVFTPNGQEGTETITYTVIDGQGGTATATVVVTIAADGTVIVVPPVTPPGGDSNNAIIETGLDGSGGAIGPFFLFALLRLFRK